MSVELKLGRNRLHYSVVTRAELFAGSSATAVLSQLLGPLRKLTVDRSIDRSVAERASRVVREFQLRLPDALIAATALEGRLTLTTRNRKDFDRVRGLRVRTP